MRLGNLAAAKSAAERLLALRNRIDDPGEAEIAGGLSCDISNRCRSAEVARLNGDGRTEAERHQQRHPSKPWGSSCIQSQSFPRAIRTAQRDLSVSYNKIGDIRAAVGTVMGR